MNQESIKKLEKITRILDDVGLACDICNSCQTAIEGIKYLGCDIVVSGVETINITQKCALDNIQKKLIYDTLIGVLNARLKETEAELEKLLLENVRSE